ncbi:LANO_0D11210g1_1 [Lachancea nothofagi CBS 11611]|uniref:LANO_0D11210g1_1 n=1 Tax=Lachancea nothofagi CBS 11611 TaxID=1266666 RepID=A0A1G4JL26_9SACH|nr:LANO_0D11210g1_1 [Lachancea nothofagi CBS 11611]
MPQSTSSTLSTVRYSEKSVKSQFAPPEMSGLNMRNATQAVLDDQHNEAIRNNDKENEVSEQTECFEKDDGLYAKDEYLDPPPDGGYGWVCCVCVAMMNFATWGPNTCYGIFLSYFLSSNYFPGATPTDFAIIGGIVICLTLMILPAVSACMSIFGYKPTLAFAIVLEVVAFVSSSFARSVGVLYVTYGVLLGISFGIIFGSNTIVIPSWFLKKRALANGLGHVGVGLGGLVFSFAVHAMIERTGDHRWAMRMLAACTFLINAVSMCFIKVREPASGQQEKKSAMEILKKSFDKSVLKITPLHYCALWSSFCTIGYVILMFSIANYATSIGMTAQQATVALAVFNGSQAIGRPFMGWFAEVIGRSNATIIIMAYDLVLLLPYWFTITKFSELVPFCFLLGFGAGVGSVNIVPLVSDVVGIQKFPAGIGYGMFGNGIGALFAEVVALRLRSPSSPRPYLRCQIFVVCMFFAGLLCLFPYRELKMRRILTAKSNNTNIEEGLRNHYKDLMRPTWSNYIRRMFLIAEA